MAVLGSPLRRLTLVILLFCLFMGSTSWRRRRSGGCVCQLGVWGQWSTCTAPCGNKGEKTRERTNYCCSVEGALTEWQTVPCNRFCYNSGTPYGDGCLCTSQYEGRCCDVRKPQGGLSFIGIQQQGNNNNVNIGSNNFNQVWNSGSKVAISVSASVTIIGLMMWVILI
ncbi:uncharacterized protein LOC144922336 [Branchiostoma floridae x Branchiostoma belcheri]